jgi:hypothetical protein
MVVVSSSSMVRIGRKARDIPVRILWNAVSTFDESSADVSMNDKLFSAVHGKQYNQFHPRVTPSHDTHSQIHSPPPLTPPSSASNRSYSLQA